MPEGGSLPPFLMIIESVPHIKISVERLDCLIGIALQCGAVTQKESLNGSCRTNSGFQRAVNALSGERIEPHLAARRRLYIKLLFVRGRSGVI